MIGATPDAMIDEILVELKCPFSMRHLKPQEIEKLSKSQQQSFFCKKEGNKLKVKENHCYLWQIQTQMYVCKAKECLFVVQTPNGINVEQINFAPETYMPALEKAKIDYKYVFVPEFFEQRIPRKLEPFKLH